MVNCIDTHVEMELSQSNLPGFYALCGEQGDVTSMVTCMVAIFGQAIGEQVCDKMDLYQDQEDLIHFRKRQKVCPEVMKKLWLSCKDAIIEDAKFEHHGFNTTNQCIKTNLDIEEIIELKEVISTYAE